MCMRPIESLRTQLLNKKVLYIIPCCSAKQHGGQTMVPAEGRIPGSIAINLRQHLFLSRQNVYRLLAPNALPHVRQDGQDFGVQEPMPADYLCAYARYTGNLYSVQGVTDLLQQGRISVAIISALYGLLHPHDYIQDYNLTMNTRGITPIWRKLLPALIDDFAAHENIETIVGLLGKTTGYNRVFGALQNRREGCPTFGVNTVLDGHGQGWVSRGLGHALLYLATGAPIPEAFSYEIPRVRA